MLYSIRKIWRNILESFWFLPSLLVIAAILLALTLVYLDQIYFAEIQITAPWLFGGSASAAQGILTAIAGSLATIASIVYSISIVSLQQASNNYSPRVLRNYVKDKYNQLVLGSYVATIIYAFLVLCTVRTDEVGISFVPALSVAAAIFFTIVNLVLLIYYISHITESLRASKIIDNIYNELINHIDTLFPEQIGRAEKEPQRAEEIIRKHEEEKTVEIKSDSAGFVEYYDEAGLERIKGSDIKLIYFLAQVGGFVGKGDTLARIYGTKELMPDIEEKVKNSISIGKERTEREDALLPVRQLKDIAIKTIQNDPTTAEYCINYLSSALCQLVQRKFPESKRSFNDNQTIFIFNRPSWEQFLEQSFLQIRNKAMKKAHASHVILAAYLRILDCSKNRQRYETVKNAIRSFKRQLKLENFEDEERKKLEKLLEGIGTKEAQKEKEFNLE